MERKIATPRKYKYFFLAVSCPFSEALIKEPYEKSLKAHIGTMKETPCPVATAFTSGTYAFYVEEALKSTSCEY